MILIYYNMFQPVRPEALNVQDTRCFSSLIPIAKVWVELAYSYTPIAYFHNRCRYKNIIQDPRCTSVYYAVKI